MGRQARRTAHRRSAELTPEELFIPQDTKINDEWDRNNALFNYRMAKQGLPGRLYAWAVIFLVAAVLLAGVVQWVQSN